ncbi:MAG TPA: NAD-dependent epimerase/dehydratase family protein [Alicyclobacillus sp.]|nr:NAD-dependent epimerase/dehydratase family protein [Alicyclobacillus sp.]
MKLFITGASGFLGRRVVQRLLRDHHEVSALARTEGQAKQLKNQGVTPVMGILESLSDWRDSLRDQEVVIHLAAKVDTWGVWDAFYQNITESTKRLAWESERSGVRRFIYISSESVLQSGKPLVDIDEQHPYPARPSSFYGRAKMLAEQACLEHVGHMEIVILRPTFIWGEDSLQLHDLIDRARKGNLPWFNHGDALFEHVYVGNVAEAVVQAVTYGRNREIYFVTNDEPMRVRDFWGEVFRRAGAPLPRMSLPSKPVYRIAGWMEAAWPKLRLKNRPPFTRFEVEFLALPRRYNIQKAKEELRYKPSVTFQQGLRLLTAGGAGGGWGG